MVISSVLAPVHGRVWKHLTPSTVKEWSDIVLADFARKDLRKGPEAGKWCPRTCRILTSKQCCFDGRAARGQSARTKTGVVQVAGVAGLLQKALTEHQLNLDGCNSETAK